MSLYVLDTDTTTLYQWDHPVICQNIAIHQADQISITIISVEEQLTGWYSFVRTAKTLDQVADAMIYLPRMSCFGLNLTFYPFQHKPSVATSRR